MAPSSTRKVPLRVSPHHLGPGVEDPAVVELGDEQPPLHPGHELVRGRRAGRDHDIARHRTEASGAQSMAGRGHSGPVGGAAVVHQAASDRVLHESERSFGGSFDIEPQADGIGP
jgi:hypothetical protein